MKLVLVHGSGATGQTWYYQRKHFRNCDAPDLPGHPDGKLCTSVEEYSDWVHDYIGEKGYRDVVLVGHSLGGAIALQYALKYPGDLKAVILIGSGARLRVVPLIIESIRNTLDDRHAWIEKLVKPLYADVDERVRDLLLPGIARSGPASQLNDFLCCDKFDVMDKIGLINLPALAIVGDQDNMTPPKYSQYMVGNMHSCKIVVIEGGTHLVFLEKPQPVNAAIDKFLSEID